MRRLVIDAATLLSWFEPAGEGRRLRDEYTGGSLVVLAPRGIVADALALLAQRTSRDPERLGRIAVEFGRLGLELRDASPPELASWIARGLSADRAAYAALASELDCPLAAGDPQLRRVAAPLVLSG